MTVHARCPHQIQSVPTAQFMGCNVAKCSSSEALAWMIAAVHNRSTTYVVTLNAQYLWLMHRDEQFRRHVLAAGLAIPEYSIVWGARRLGISGLQHIGGIDLLRAFLQFAPREGFRVYLLGARTEVVRTLAEQLTGKWGSALVSGWHDGFLQPADEARVAHEISTLRPDAVFVAMGVPRQDHWIQRYASSLAIPLCMGVGGSFDVLAGFKPDTPPWARGRGLEWLYRTSLDPAAYARRYAIQNTWFVCEVYRERLRRLRREGASGGANAG